jgi:hypothetical protein
MMTSHLLAGFIATGLLRYIRRLLRINHLPERISVLAIGRG